MSPMSESEMNEDNTHIYAEYVYKYIKNISSTKMNGRLERREGDKKGLVVYMAKMTDLELKRCASCMQF